MTTSIPRGVMSPTSNGVSGVPRTWPSPSTSPYRTGWLPTSKPPATARTSPYHESVPHASSMSSYQPQQQHNGQVNGSRSSVNCASKLQLNFSKREQSPESLRQVCDRPEGVRSQPVQHHVGRAVGSLLVNGYCHESEVIGPGSVCDGRLNSAEQCCGDCLEQRNCSLPPSTSVNPAPGLLSSSQVPLETFPVVEVPLPTISDGSGEPVSSVEPERSSLEKSQHMASNCGEVAKDSEHLNQDATAPEARLIGLQSDMVNESASMNQTHQTTQHLHSTDDNDEAQKQPSDDRTVTLSPLYRESDMLLSARKSSIDYFQKVSCLPLTRFKP